VDLVFLATGASVNDDSVVTAAGQPSSDRIILVISQDLPQAIRSALGERKDSGVVVLSDAGGRMGQSPGGAARAWGAMGDEGRVARTSWYVIDRAGRVGWAAGKPVPTEPGENRPPLKVVEETGQ
jgi:hypothetical protein